MDMPKCNPQNKSCIQERTKRLFLFVKFSSYRVFYFFVKSKSKPLFFDEGLLLFILSHARCANFNFVEYVGLAFKKC